MSKFTDVSGYLYELKFWQFLFEANDINLGVNKILMLLRVTGFYEIIYRERVRTKGTKFDP